MIDPINDLHANINVLKFALKFQFAHGLSLLSLEESEKHKAEFLRAFDSIQLPDEIIMGSEQTESEFLKLHRDLAEQFVHDVADSEALFRKSNGTH